MDKKLPLVDRSFVHCLLVCDLLKPLTIFERYTFCQGKGLSSLAPSRNAIALSYQNLKLEPKLVMNAFFSFATGIHKNCTNAKNPMIAKPMFISITLSSHVSLLPLPKYIGTVLGD